MASKDNFKKGFLEVLVLEILSRHDCYGYEIAQIIKEESNNYISVLVSSLYPTLYKLEEQDMITSYRKRVGQKMERVYYHLEESGYKELEEQKIAFFDTMHAISHILENETAHKEEKIV